MFERCLKLNTEEGNGAEHDIEVHEERKERLKWSKRALIHVFELTNCYM